MIDEITAAAAFLTRLVAKNDCLQPDKVDRFEEELVSVLTEKFKNHWFPDRPSKGQAYRCLRINENIRREPTIEQVCKNIGINYADLVLPLEITIWIDPFEVTCRFGESKGSFCTVADFHDGNKENYVDQINVDELEQKSLERAKQASFDMINSRKRKARAYLKNGFVNSNSNGLYSSIDYSNGLQTATTSSSYYPHHGAYYGAGGGGGSPKFGTSSYGPTATSPMFASNSYSTLSPTSRMGMGASYRQMGFMSSMNGSGAYGSKYSRGLFNGSSSLSFGSNYSSTSSTNPPNDRYHWSNKNGLKAV